MKYKQLNTYIADISHNHTTCGGVLFSKEKAKIWPVLAILSRNYALFGVLFYKWCNVVVYQNGQISGMNTYTLTPKYTHTQTHSHAMQIIRHKLVERHTFSD